MEFYSGPSPGEFKNPPSKFRGSFSPPTQRNAKEGPVPVLVPVLVPVPVPVSVFKEGPEGGGYN